MNLISICKFAVNLLAFSTLELLYLIKFVRLTAFLL